MHILRNGSRFSSDVPSEYFTGQVRIETLMQPDDPGHIFAASVTFEPGARTNWHSHPLGQTLLVTAGIGWTQHEGGPVEEIHPGDLVWFQPNERGWHGASAEHAMTHIAIQAALDGKMVDWMEHVTDVQYQIAQSA